MSTTLTVARVSALPRVNLLPPEIAAARRFRRVQAGLGLVMVGTVAAVGVVWGHAKGEVAQAEQALAEVQGQTAALTAEQATYLHVPSVYERVETAEAQVQLAMGDEVRWADYLHDLSLTVPEDVWLSTLTVASGGDAVAASAAPLSSSGIATVTFDGRALAHQDVATWLESLETIPGFVDASFSRSEKQELDMGDGSTEDYVTFSSTVTVTAEALSGTYSPAVGD